MATPDPAPPLPVKPRGVWPMIVGSAGLYLCATGAWVTGDYQAHSYVGDQLYARAAQMEAHPGASLFILGGLGTAVVFLGFAVWLFLQWRGAPVRGKQVPPVPAWAPLAAVLYAASGLGNAIVTFLRRSAAQNGKPDGAEIRFDFTPEYGWALAFFLLLLIGAILYRKSLTRASASS